MTVEPVHIEARSITRLGAESASAALRRLTGELGSALSRLNVLEKRCAELEHAEAQRDSHANTIRLLGEQLIDITGELASARQELGLLRERPLLVARDGGRACLRCDREIRRGEAYELRQDLGPDQLEHVHCPDVAT